MLRKSPLWLAALSVAASVTFAPVESSAGGYFGPRYGTVPVLYAGAYYGGAGSRPNLRPRWVGARDIRRRNSRNIKHSPPWFSRWWANGLQLSSRSVALGS